MRRSTGLSPASDRHPARSHRAAFPSHPRLWHEAESVLSLPPAPCPPGAASTRLSLAAAASPGLGSAPVLLRLLHWSRLFFLILLMFSVTLSHCSAVSSVPPIFSVNPAVHSVLPRLRSISDRKYVTRGPATIRIFIMQTLLFSLRRFLLTLPPLSPWEREAGKELGSRSILLCG